MIVLSGGEYTGTNNCGLAIRKSVKLVPAEGDIVTIDCEGSSFHFHVESGSTLMIENLNITRGAGLKGNAFQGRGGCIVVEGSGGVSITNSKLSHCSAVWGGAVALIGKDSSLVLASSVVESCTASAGGGAVALQGISRLMLEDSVLEGNVADGQGGAIHLSGSSECAIQGGRLEGNQARRGGALFVSDGSASTVKGTLLTGNMACATPGSCRSAPCAAADLSGEEGLGGGIGTERSAVVTLEGVQLVGNEARGSGGCVHHAGLELRLMGEVVMRECKACNSGGAMEALGLVSVESGGEAVLERNSVDNPLSGEGYGGAASLVGSGASLRVSEGALLTVRFNTARSDGGGVHMTDGGTLNVQAQACSADCSPKGSTCDLSCFSSACGWDKGNCNSLFEDVSTAPCVRDAGQDSTWLLEQAGASSDCGSSCLTPSCDWGQQPNSTGACSDSCSAQGSEIRGCPLFDAMAYGSLLAQSGGSSSGFKPRLPGAGLDYSPEELLSLKDKPLGDVLKQYPGCGSVALNFVGNEALGGNGGGIFQESCDAGLTGRGICFVGISSSAGSVLANFESNRAAGSGGAFYTGCDEIGEPCEALLNDALDFGKWSAEKIRLVGNEAAGYGNDMATFPAEVAILSAKTTYLPGQDPVDVVLQLKDGRGQVVKALDLSANPYLVETFACPEGIECSVTNSWVPAAFHPLAREDSNLLTVDTPQLLRCPASSQGNTSLVVHVRVFGADDERLHQEIEVSCLPCEDGTSRRERDGMWWCESCPAGSYILDFNEAREGCIRCPTGLVCNGTSVVVPKTEGAVWNIVDRAYSLASCPNGMRTLSQSGDLQECLFCPQGHQCTDVSCSECSPCTPGSYKADQSSKECKLCPEDTYSESEGSTSAEQCVACPQNAGTRGQRGQSSIEACKCAPRNYRHTHASGEIVCQTCPVGARCSDAEETCALQLPQPQCDGQPLVGTWVLVEGSSSGRRSSNSSHGGGSYVNDTGDIVNGTSESVGSGSADTGDSGESSLNGSVSGTGASVNGSSESGGSNGTGDGSGGDDTDLNDRGKMWVLTSCPEGHSLLNTLIKQPAVDPFSSELFSYDSQQCMPCDARLEYIEDPNTQLCKTCPMGLKCTGGKDFSAKVQGSTWEYDEDGVLKLLSCPLGYRQISGDAVGDADQECQPCPAGTLCLTEPCSECSPCERGTFKASAMWEACVPCPTDTYNPSMGSTSQSECLPCPSGATTGGAGGQTQEEACQCDKKDYYDAVINGKKACAICPVGARCSDQRCGLGSDSATGTTSGRRSGNVNSTNSSDGTVSSGAGDGGNGDANTSSSNVNLSSAPVDGGSGIANSNTSGGNASSATGDGSSGSTDDAASGADGAPDDMDSGSTTSDGVCTIVGSWARGPANPAGEYKLTDCPEGYSRINTLGGMSVALDSTGFSQVAQQCKKCDRAEYVLNPNTDACQPCPSGLSCNGGSSYSKKEPLDAVWEVQGQLLVLKSCPAGYERVSEPASLQRCRPCPAGSECVSPPCDTCTACAAGTFKAFKLPVPCQACESGTYNDKVGSTTPSDCTPCPAGAHTPGPGSTSADECKCAGCRFADQTWCPEADYFVPNPSDGATPKCEICPVGAVCNGMNLRTRDNLQGAVWELVGTQYRLQSCPVGHQLINDEHNLQECRKCGPSQFIERSDFTCQRCPEAAVCPNGGPPIFAAMQITITLMLKGITASDIDASKEELLTQALAGALGVNPSVVILDFQSVGLRNIPSSSSSALRYAGPPSLRRQSATAGLKIVGNAYTSAGSAAALGDVTSDGLAGQLNEKLSKILPGVSAAVLGMDSQSAVSGKFDGWVMERFAGGWMLVGCPNGTLIVNADLSNQSCRRCAENTYSVNPFDGCNGACAWRSCNPCPPGLICKDGRTVPRVAGSVWEPERVGTDVTVTVLRVKSCPEGHVMIRSSEASVQAAADDDCVRCPVGHYSLETARFSETNGSLLVSERASELVSGFDMCLPCPAGQASCRVTTVSDGTSVQVVKPSSGYWRGTQMICPEEACSSWSGVCEAEQCFPLHDERRAECEGNCRVTAMIYRCPPGACPQIGQSSDVEFMNTCAEGHEGPVCGQCSEGYALEAVTCRSCLDNGARLEAVATFVALSFVLWLYFSFRPLLRGCFDPLSKISDACWKLVFRCMGFAVQTKEGGSEEDAESARFQTLFFRLREILVGYCKIIVSFLQISGSFLAVFSVEWPQEIVTFWAGLSSIVQIDVFNFPGIACFTKDATFREKLLFSTVLIPGVSLVLCIAPLIAFARRGRDEQGTATFQEAVNLFFFSLLSLTFTTYPAISRTILSSFATSYLGADGCWLRSDYTFACPGSGDLEWIWSVIFTALIIVGVPVFMLGALLLHGVPKLAKAKYSGALFQGLLNSYRGSIKSKFVQNISEKGRDGAAVARVQHQAVEALRALREGGGVGEGTFAGTFAVPVSSKREVLIEALEELGVAYKIDDSQLNRLLLASFPLFEMDRCMDEQDCFEKFIGAVSIVKSLHDLEGADFEKLSRNQITLLLFHLYLGEREARKHAEVGEGDAPKPEDGMGSASDQPKVWPKSKSKSVANDKLWNRFGASIMGNQSLDRSHQYKVNHGESWSGSADRDGQDRLTALGQFLKELESKTISTPNLRQLLIRAAVKQEAQGLIAVTPPKWDGSFEGESEVIDRIGFLFQMYRPAVWWFDIFLTLEKLLMCAILIFAWPGSDSQVFAGFFVTFATLVLVAILRPYADPALGFMQLFALGIQSLSLLVGILLITQQFADIVGSSDLEGQALGIVLVLLNVSTFFAPIVMLESFAGFGDRVVSAAEGKLPKALGGDSRDIKDGDYHPPLTELGEPPIDDFYIETDMIAEANAGELSWEVQQASTVYMQMPQINFATRKEQQGPGKRGAIKARSVLSVPSPPTPQGFFDTSLSKRNLSMVEEHPLSQTSTPIPGSGVGTISPVESRPMYSDVLRTEYSRRCTSVGFDEIFPDTPSEPASAEVPAVSFSTRNVD